MGFNFVWFDLLLTAQGECGGQAGGEDVMRMGVTGLGPESWLSVGVSRSSERREKAAGSAWG